jgi:phage gpG-like protein
MANTAFIVDNKEALKMFNRAENAFKNMQKPLKETRTYELKQIQEAFKVSGKNITGQRWKSLRPSTVKEKILSGFTTRILERTGKMKKSFRSIKLNKEELQITSKGVKYFAQHQQGKDGSTFKAGIPQRQMLGFSKTMIRKITDIFINFIDKTIKHG